MIAPDRFATGTAPPTTGPPDNFTQNLSDQPVDPQSAVGPVATMTYSPAGGVEYQQASAVGPNFHVPAGKFPDQRVGG